MSYVKLNYKRPTKEFTDYIVGKLNAIYGNIKDLKAVDVDYKAWDDSDQPGIDERITFSMPDGKKFEAAMTHNRWSDFKEI